MKFQHCGRLTASAVPFLRWAGSKRRLVPILRTYWKPYHNRYLEPFAGSACLFFSLNPRRAILGDLNGELMSTYLEVKYRLDAVVKRLSRMTRSQREYTKLRSQNPKVLAPSARAARFIYLNRCCFNGLYRTNLNGEFNVPYGGEKSGSMPSPELLSRCSKQLRKARLVAADFEQVLHHARKGDFVYIDPPFAVRARRVFNEYHPDTFHGPDIKRLRGWLEKLDKRGISFLVSYAESAEARILGKGFLCRRVSVRRNIGGFATSRSNSYEVLISNT
jgi:DNA adenine methylase